VVARCEISKRESYRRGGGFSPHLRSGAERCGEEQSVAVMKLGVSALGVRRGESGGRR
jgi:hypothetical protein